MSSTLTRKGGKTVADIAARLPITVEQPPCIHLQGFIPQAVMKWGGRAILDTNYNYKGWQKTIAGYSISLLPDRQGYVGNNDPGVEKVKNAFFQWLEKCFQEMNRRGKRQEGCMRPDSNILTIIDSPDGLFHFRCSPNRSYGYMYMYAWVDQGIKEDQS